MSLSLPWPQKGEQGLAGDKGDRGDAGPGVPAGGSAGQVLVKQSSADYDTAWAAASGGGGPESDPVFAASAAAGIDGTDLAHWDSAYLWGDHAAAGYATAAQLANSVEAHNGDTTGVHGIADTSVLVVTSDPRLSNARTPTAHAASHATGQSDAIAPAAIGAAAAADLTSHAALTTAAHGGIVAASDPRLTDARTPTAHVHAAGDVASGTLDGDRLPAVSATKRGGVPATGTPSGKFLRDDATWQTPAGGSGTATKPTLIFMPAANEPPASGYATPDARNGHPVLDFDDAAIESAIFSAVLPRSYAGGGLTVTLSWAATSATTGNVVWGVSFERLAPAGTDMDADDFGAEKTATAAADGVSGKITATSIAFADGAEIDSIVGGDVLRVRVRRIANDAADTMAGDAEIVAVEVRET